MSVERQDRVKQPCRSGRSIEIRRPDGGLTPINYVRNSRISSREVQRRPPPCLLAFVPRLHVGQHSRHRQTLLNKLFQLAVVAALTALSLVFPMDVDSLTPTQKAAFDQLQALTDGGDPEVAIGVLASVDWDVQVCVKLLAVCELLAGCSVSYIEVYRCTSRLRGHPCTTCG